MSNLGNKEIMANNIKKYMDRNNVNQTQLCNELGFKQSTFSDWVNAKTYPRIDKIEMLANYFGIEKSDLVEDKRSRDSDIYTQLDISYIKVPLYGPISCGTGMFVDEDVIEYVAVPDNGLNPNLEYFAQYAEGDSMITAGIDHGDIIIFQKSNTIDDGKIGCFCIDDNFATCKKIKKGTSFIQLIPMNPKYDPIVIDLNDNNFRIVGILKKVIKDFD